MTLLIKTNGSATPLYPVIPDFFETELLNDSFGPEEWVPAVNVYENESDYQIELVAPGMNEDDFTVKVEDGMLTISGETEEEEDETDVNYLRREYNYNSFSRTFTLPEDAIGDDITACYEDGMLQLSIPKNAMVSSEAREIPVL